MKNVTWTLIALALLLAAACKKDKPVLMGVDPIGADPTTPVPDSDNLTPSVSKYLKSINNPNGYGFDVHYVDERNYRVKSINVQVNNMRKSYTVGSSATAERVELLPDISVTKDGQALRVYRYDYDKQNKLNKIETLQKGELVEHVDVYRENGRITACKYFATGQLIPAMERYITIVGSMMTPAQKQACEQKAMDILKKLTTMFKNNPNMSVPPPTKPVPKPNPDRKSNPNRKPSINDNDQNTPKPTKEVTGSSWLTRIKNGFNTLTKNPIVQVISKSVWNQFAPKELKEQFDNIRLAVSGAMLSMPRVNIDDTMAETLLSKILELIQNSNNIDLQLGTLNYTWGDKIVNRVDIQTMDLFGQPINDLQRAYTYTYDDKINPRNQTGVLKWIYIPDFADAHFTPMYLSAHNCTEIKETNRGSIYKEQYSYIDQNYPMTSSITAYDKLGGPAKSSSATFLYSTPSP